MNDKFNNKSMPKTAPTFRTQGAQAGVRPHSRKRSGKKRRHAGAFSLHGKARHAGHPPSQAEIRHRRKNVLLGLYAALCAEIGFALLTSPALAIKKVRARGLETLPPSEQQQTLQALNVARGTNWFRVPLRRLRQDTSSLPWVRTASVERSYSNTLFAHVAPRVPFIALKVGTVWYETDAEGVPIRLARPRVANRLPRVVLQVPHTVQTGVVLGDPAVTGAIQIVREMKQEPRLSASKIVIDQSDNICLNMRDGMEFQMGQNAELAAKIALVKRIYARDPSIGQTLAAVNLSSPSTPACTLRAAQAAPPLLMPSLPPNSRARP